MRAVPLGLAVAILATAAAVPATALDVQRTVTTLPTDGPATCRFAHQDAASFAAPHAVVADQFGTMYVAETGTDRIRRVAVDGTITVVAGSAQFDTPTDVDLADGVLFVADAGNDRIRRIATNGTVTTYAGGTEGFADGPALSARFSSPTGVAVQPNGVVFVADNANHVIRRIGRSGAVTTYAGQPGVIGKRNGPREDALFRNPSRLRYDPTDDALYVADTGNHRIRRIAADGTVTTHAGSTRGWADGVGRDAQFDKPTGLEVSDGTVYVADQANDRVRRIAPDRQVTTHAGSTRGFVDGASGDARFAAPKGVALLPDGVLAVADRDNRAIRTVRDCIATTTTTAVSVGASSLVVTGGVSPDRDGRYLQVTLRRQVDGVFEDVATALPVLSGASTYEVGFDRPQPGRCRVVASYLGDKQHLASRDIVTFDC